MKVIEWYQREMDTLKYVVYGEVVGNERSLLAAWLLTIWGSIVWSWNFRVVCAWRGHDWMDDSYGGPESGCMAAHCERCGFGFHTTLY